MPIKDEPEYKLGWEWAAEYGVSLAELFTAKDLSTPELRTQLFKEAARRWPSQRDSFDNDLKQMTFVAGAMKAMTRHIPAEEAGAVMEAALEMGAGYSSYKAIAHWLNELKAKPRGWWRTKRGDATPQDVLNALSVAWRIDRKREGSTKSPKSKWEIMIAQMGSRELAALATLQNISIQKDGIYISYIVEGEEGDFQMLADWVREGGVTRQYPGEIVG